MKSPLSKIWRTAAVVGAMALIPTLALGAEPLPDKLAASPMAQARGDPVIAARRAAERGKFGLIWGATLASSGPIGVTCFAQTWIRSNPEDQSLVEDVVSYTDYIGPDYGKVAAAENADTAFGKAYNAVIIASPDFPYSDVCRPHRDDDPWNGLYNRNWSAPATSKHPRVTSLAAASRVGSLPKVDAFLRAGAAVDQPDAFGLSPLSWALIRGHDAVALRLLKAGATPTFEALRFAVAYGRTDVLRRMWTPENLENARPAASELARAAVFMGHADTLLAVMDKTKAQLDDETVVGLVAIALRHRERAIAKLLLHRWGRELPVADLFSAAIMAGDLRYVDRALRLGADPNGVIGRSEEPALYFVANSLATASAPAVARRLIKAGASAERSKVGGETPLQALRRFGLKPPSDTYIGEGAASRRITLRGREELVQVLISETHP